MDILHDLATGTGAILAYLGIGLVLLFVGYVTIDLLTPGRLGRQVYEERNTNAAIVLGSAMLSIGIIVSVAIFTSGRNFGRGLAFSSGFGFVGVVLLGVSFKLIDLVTPGDLGAICTGTTAHPAVWVTAAEQIAIALIVAAAIA